MFRCIHCGAHVEELYREYSATNIRLMPCVKCSKTADPFVETDTLGIIVAILFHRRGIFMHAVNNRERSSPQLGEELWFATLRVPVLTMFCEAYLIWTCSEATNSVMDISFLRHPNSFSATVVATGMSQIVYRAVIVLLVSVLGFNWDSSKLLNAVLLSELHSIVIAMLVVCGAPNIYYLLLVFIMLSVSLAKGLQVSIGSTPLTGLLIAVIAWVMRLTFATFYANYVATTLLLQLSY
eukprot:m.103729 g.103729  ORF g.103729 m.103729 type:complete len:238 (+) comp13820_c0_seq8:182-895(+)